MRTRRLMGTLALATAVAFFTGAGTAYADVAPAGNVLLGLGVVFIVGVGLFILVVAVVAFLVIRAIAKKKPPAQPPAEPAAPAPEPVPPAEGAGPRD
jgi:hypothetical protein